MEVIPGAGTEFLSLNSPFEFEDVNKAPKKYIYKTSGVKQDEVVVEGSGMEPEKSENEINVTSK